MEKQTETAKAKLVSKLEGASLGQLFGTLQKFFVKAAEYLPAQAASLNDLASHIGASVDTNGDFSVAANRVAAQKEYAYQLNNVQKQIVKGAGEKLSPAVDMLTQISLRLAP